MVEAHEVQGSSGAVPSDVKDLSLSPRGMLRIEWADRDMPVLRLDPRALRAREAAGGRAHRRVPARHHRDRQPHAHAEGRRGRGGAVRLEPALHPGRRGRRAGGRLRHPDLRHQGRGPRDLLRATSTPSSTPARRSPWTTAPTWWRCSTAERADAARRTSSAAPRRPPPASSACGPWRRTARWSYPVIAVNDADTKHLFDNRYGTGQSTLDGIMRATNLLLAGRGRGRGRLRLVRPGRRHARQGPGRRRHRHRGRPVRALEAAMDGFRVMPMAEAAPHRRRLRHRRPATSTCSRARALRGDEGRRHPRQLRPLRRGDRHPGAGRAAVSRGARCASSSRSTVCRRPAASTCWAKAGWSTWPPPRATRPRDGHELRQPGAGRRVHGRRTRRELETKVYDVPDEIDKEIARLKLAAVGIRDRRADRGAGEVPRQLGYRHVGGGC